jgi:hypothetical protein
LGAWAAAAALWSGGAEMLVKLVGSIVVMVVAAAAALWWWRDEPALKAVLPEAVRHWSGWQQLPSRPAGGSASTRPSGTAAPSAQARKCVGGGQVVYTNEACPAGTQQQAVSGGTLTVLPAVAVPRPAAPAGSAVSPLRRLAGDGAPANLPEQQVEQALRR